MYICATSLNVALEVCVGMSVHEIFVLVTIGGGGNNGKQDKVCERCM